MNPSIQIDLPLDLFAVLGAWEDRQRPAADRTTLLVFRHIINHHLGAKSLMASASMTLGPRLLASTSPRLETSL